MRSSGRWFSGRPGRSRAPILCFLVLLAGAVSAAGESPPRGFEDHPAWPDTRAAHLARELLGIINSRDAAAALRFIRENYDPSAWEHFPASNSAAWLAGIAARENALDFHAVRTYRDAPQDLGIVVVLHDRVTDAWRGLTLSFSPQPPRKITGVTVIPVSPPSTDPSRWTALTSEGFIGDVDGYLGKMTDEDRFSGVALVARNGDVIFRKAYGQANRRFNVPNREDTRFNLGSMNKMFTSVAVMQLVGRKKLELDAPISRYLPPGWLDPQLASRITPRHLLSHTSGLGDYLESLWDHSRLLYRELDDYRPLMEGIELQFQPGTDWAYSNTGFLLLGVLIEQVSGTPYHEYLAAHIFGPAGMKDTDCYEVDRPVPNVASGYSRESDGSFRDNILMHVAKGGPAGGGYSTVDDLLRFARAMRGGVLLDDRLREMVWTATAASKNIWPYGFGFDVRGGEANRGVGHAGSFPGVSSDLHIWLDTGWTAVVLSNIDGGASLAMPRIEHGLARMARSSGVEP